MEETCSPPLSLMDSSSPSEMNYAERVAFQNNMEVGDNNPIPSQEELPGPGLDKLTAALVPAYNYNVATTIPTPPHAETSFQPTPPTANPYSANTLAGPSLWDGDFSAMSIFGTNEFLQNDVSNIACFLLYIVTFLRQRNLEEHNGDNIPQLKLFGEAA